MEMVICQETPSHGKKIYGNLTAARHAPSKKVQITRYYVIWMCAFLSVKKNYGKIGPRRAAVVCWPMTNLFSISIILSTTIVYTYNGYDFAQTSSSHSAAWIALRPKSIRRVEGGCNLSHRERGAAGCGWVAKYGDSGSLR